MERIARTTGEAAARRGSYNPHDPATLDDSRRMTQSKGTCQASKGSGVSIDRTAGHPWSRRQEGGRSAQPKHFNLTTKAQRHYRKDRKDPDGLGRRRVDEDRTASSARCSLEWIALSGPIVSWCLYGEQFRLNVSCGARSVRWWMDRAPASPPAEIMCSGSRSQSQAI